MWGKAQKLLEVDKNLSPLIQKWGKCSIRKSTRNLYFEEIMESIVEQQLSGKAAKVIWGRARGVITASSPTPLSPITPKQVLDLADISLREAGLSWAKVKYVKDLAQKAEGGEVKIETLDTLADEDVIQELVKVKGIGRWTAEMFLMFTLARSDVFPLDDLGIKKGMEKLYNEPMTRERMEKLSQKWKPFRTVASWYVWRALD